MQPADSLNALIISILKKAAPSELEAFERTDGSVVRAALRLSPEQISRMVSSDPDSNKPINPRLGAVAHATLEGLELCVSLTTILVHLWHTRNLFRETKEQESMREKLKAIWLELLIKRGVSSELAEEIVSEYSDDLSAVLRPQDRSKDQKKA